MDCFYSSDFTIYLVFFSFLISKYIFFKTKKSCYLVTTFYDSPYGIRTRVTAVKRRCLNPLTNGPFLQRNLLYQFIFICQHFFEKKSRNFRLLLNALEDYKVYYLFSSILDLISS